MNTETMIAAAVLAIATLSVGACISVMLSVSSAGYRLHCSVRRAMLVMRWHWYALRWKMSDAAFYTRVWITNKRMGF